MVNWLVGFVYYAVMAERILYAIASLLCQTCHLKGTSRHARVVGASCQIGRLRGL